MVVNFHFYQDNQQLKLLDDETFFCGRQTDNSSHHDNEQASKYTWKKNQYTQTNKSFPQEPVY